jgi:signal transduction histidine kinase
MVETRRGLEIIIEAASTLFDFRSIQRLAEGVLTQIASLLNVECAGILVLREGNKPNETFAVLAGSGCYRHLAEGGAALERELEALVREAFEGRRHELRETRSVLYFRTGSGRELVAILEAGRNVSDTDRALVEVFCSRLSAAFDNVMLYEQLQDANARLEERVAQRTRELTTANDRLAAQREQLRRANRFKNEVLGMVAHDIKNPLSVILGRSEMLSEFLEQEPVPVDMARTQLGHIRDSATRLTGMANLLITDAMSDALAIQIRQEPVDVPALVAEIVDGNRPLAAQKSQTISLDQPGPWVMCGDGDRLREAIDNLVGNAVKYSPAGASIEVAVEPQGESLAIRVRDHGPGLLPEDMSRLFGRFQRLSARPTGGETSTGLGLSIAKRIIDLHGGSIAARSDGPGTGSTFEIVLPQELPNTQDPRYFQEPGDAG